MPFILEWKGEQVKVKTKQQVANGMNMTGGYAVQVSQHNAPRKTGFMAGTIEIVKKAEAHDLELIWGNVTAKYTLWQEIGSRGRPGRYFLRNGADQAYSKLIGFIKQSG